VIDSQAKILYNNFSFWERSQKHPKIEEITLILSKIMGIVDKLSNIIAKNTESALKKDVLE
jgi:hypothetical protein